MKMSSEVKDLFEAFSHFQSEVKDVIRDCESLNYKYAKLEQLVKMRETFNKFGLSFTQLIGDCSQGYVEVENLVMHKSGQYFSKVTKLACGSVPVNKYGKESMSVAQHIGSVITYARKYSLLGLAGVAQENDDDDAALPEGTTQTFYKSSNRAASVEVPTKQSSLEEEAKRVSLHIKLCHLIEKYSISADKINEWKDYFKVSDTGSLNVGQLTAIIKKVEEFYSGNTKSVVSESNGNAATLN